MRYVTYLRVSTDRQGQSGLGLEAQRKAVLDHVTGKGEIAAEFVEIGSISIKVPKVPQDFFIELMLLGFLPFLRFCFCNHFMRPFSGVGCRG